MIKKLHQKLISKEITAKELAEGCLEKIEKQDKEIKAFISLNKKDLILEQARIVDEKINKGEEINLLEGIPFAVKDNILALRMRTTAGSKMLENYESSFEATVVEKLKKQGAILIGKTNLDEFGMGSSTENSAFFITKNPSDLKRVAGGSSGGSAAAVKSEMVPFAIGSDTGGSVRQPASFCGVVGFKPSYGTVSRYGLIALASSMDTICPLANSVEDAEIVFKTIQGKDSMDATSQTLYEKDNPKLNIKNLRIGLPKEYFQKELDKEVKECIEEAIEKIKSQGIEVKEVNLPMAPYALPCYHIIMSAEASANLARLDGIRYGKDKDLRIENLQDLYTKSRGKNLGSEVKKRIIFGIYVLSSDNYDAYYKKALQVRKLIIDDFNKVFKQVDFLLTPTTPFSAFKIGEKANNSLAMSFSDLLTVGANLSGMPAISLPCAVKQNTLPIGLQLMGPYLSDYSLLNLAKFIQQIIN